MDRIQVLRNSILRAKTAYYYGSTPLMFDAQYDAMESELAALSPNDPVLAIVGSPVPPDSLLVKAEHAMPMGSQDKLNSEEEFRSWWTKNKVTSVNASLKADGGSAAAYFDQGPLKQSISRGDGLIGDDITANAMRFAGLPVWAGSNAIGFTGSIRFEAILTVENWAVVDPDMPTNPRNVGNGIMGRKNGVHCEYLTAYAFDIDEIVDGKRIEWDKEDQKIKRLKELGFNVILNETCNSVDEAIEFFRKVEKQRPNLEMWIDGVVFKINDVRQQLALGVVGNKPKGQVAWKFEVVGVETVLESITISGGHHGGLYPTAVFTPVQIGGTTVSCASLSNFDEIDRLGIAIGDKILVAKMNEIIPGVLQVIERPEYRKTIDRPTCCPFCNGEVGYKKNTSGNDGVLLMCLNPECEKKSTGKIRKWINSTNILGIGDTLLEALVDRFGVQDASDLYTLKDRKSDLVNLVTNDDRGLKLGEKRATTVLEAIESKRVLDLDVFLGSLGIEGLGKRRVEIIANKVGIELNSLDKWMTGKLRDADFAAMAGVPGIGKQIQDGIESFSEVIEKMLANGVVVNGLLPKAQAIEGARTLCISGKLNSGKKKADYADALRVVGIELVDDVSKGLNFLVLADPGSNSSKAQKAQKLGISIISEEEMILLAEG
jgi:DNA ligase (NAD+)